MNKNFAMTVLQPVSHARAEACPPPCVNTTNKLQPFGHRRGIKTSKPALREVWSREPERLASLGKRNSYLPSLAVEYFQPPRGLGGCSAFAFAPSFARGPWRPS